MSPEMLTLVAAVLAYDMALEICDALSSPGREADCCGCPLGRRAPFWSRRLRS
jgi:hypothetical protein